MGFFRSRSRKEPESISSGDERKELSFNLSDLDLLSMVKMPEELKKRVRDARDMLDKKALEICGVSPENDKFKEIARMQTLVSSDPKTAYLISQAKQTYGCVYGLNVSMSFSKKEIEEFTESSKSIHGPWADGVRSKLSNAIKK